MDINHFVKIAEELGVKVKQVTDTAELLDGGATVPFISRYRKEVTGSLDEVQVAAIRDRVQQLRDLDKRREAILKSIQEQQKLTPELEKKINAAETMSILEDLYLPFKPKRRTKATVAREKGLEPLAEKIFSQDSFDLEAEASTYINEEKEVTSVEEALQGARDIIAEWVNENVELRKKMRTFFIEEGLFVSKVIPGKEDEAIKYKDYFDWTEPIKSAPSHRVLAMRRGEKELFLMLDSCPDEISAIALMEKTVLENASNASVEQVKLAIKDCYKRLLKPSMETEVRLYTKKKADEEAIRVFAENLRQLLLAAPLGEKAVMAIDPGFRTGCKTVCLGPQGQLLSFDAIYPNEPQKKTAEAGATVRHLVEKHQVEAIAIGNGTASRETESFVKSLGLPKNVIITMVNESGASIYSASDVAREEFPDMDLTVRGAVSIGRRLMDPLAELVKIDAKSIGVGQYQHDVDQNALKNSLDDTVMSCVNGVGVEVNTASKQLLTYVSGLGPVLAQNIVSYRNENGPFKSRDEIKKVPRLGDKAFEQAAGFLRVRNAVNPLDASAVHPERYALVEKMAKDLSASVSDLMTSEELRAKVVLKNYVSEEVGLPTLEDIMAEIAKPGRDPRETFEVFNFQEGVNEVKDLKVGMKLPGIVTNITKFGAFVDIGVHQDGLVHLSQLADKYVSDPAEIVAVSQKVEVTVMEVDIPRKRIGLSMKSDPFGAKPKTQKSDRSDSSRGKAKEPEGDLAAKLAMLQNKFR
ncbi:Transcription accessory protein (S1 RNA-binding domain) [Indibacter alkaliphilus LW1]|uniref:Transcription accessory protein (S1 RNA-binding domain) n=1 Tax=Indibacter alkaliphilus (strain CCUG 57479 / KCTC 22604 / LW1) TaxID=1189612 RepID=S2DU74_INDAL|nr:Tex family protein [Indibacter alkaliphilus]EOZ95611.1 Transcription accessory protein (S1 RNA-binding domain) [Indibacter alkaliphilus LW1]